MLNPTFYKILLYPLLLLVIACNSISSQKEGNKNNEVLTDRAAIANEMENILIKGMMEKWYPLCIDTIYGGFLSSFDSVWNPTKRQAKFIVTQARHTYASAQMAKIYPENKLYRDISEHGYKFLRDVMWDKEYGGYFTMTNREGEVFEDTRYESTKIAYGNAFAIYGLAAYFEISQDSSALELAIKSFHWLEEHSYDPEYGGYFQFLKRDGTPFKNGNEATPPKDQNSSIHIIEAFTELYKVWKDEHLKTRINELLVLIRDTITTEKGYMNLYFRQDWSPVYYTDTEFPGGKNTHVFDHISFGHDIETAFLLLEASKVIGNENDVITNRISKKMTDHVIDNGWESETGATFDAGYYFENQDKITILDSTTQWWAAAETFHTILMMSTFYPDDPINYYEKFTITWNYCKKYLIDHEDGGWYRVGLNKVPQITNANKGDIWKGNYHNTRSLIKCIQILRGEKNDHI